MPFLRGFVCIILAITFAYGQQWNNQSIHTFYQEIISKYGNKELQKIFFSQSQYPYTQWINKPYHHNSIIFSLSTVLHEMQHGMDNIIENTDSTNTYKYFLFENCIIYVPQSRFFQTDLLNNMIPKSLSDSIFRFNIYVGNKNQISDYKKYLRINSGGTVSYSIHHGIFGLIEEFLAYYRGLQVLSNIYPYFKKQLQSLNSSSIEKKQELGIFKYYVLQECNAFYEFQLFIAWYLQYASMNNKEAYQGFYSNIPLRIVFSYIHNSYKQLIDTMLYQLDTIPVYKTDIHFIRELNFDGSDNDICRYIYYSDVVSENYKNNLVEKIILTDGKTAWKFIGEREEYLFFKKVYNKLKKILFKNFKSLTGAKLFSFLTNPEETLMFLKRHSTELILYEIDKFKVNYNDCLTKSKYCNP
ncbi:MAG: hypothetical protein N2167_04405 [Flavobacteriales bacterium]|nr:hypothetical protein [Flavobacteriales bacterium]